MAEEVVLRFDNVKFEYLHKTPILNEACFSVRKGAKITLMGQNGSGKSTIFGLIKKELTPKSGQISAANNATIGAASQTMAREYFELSVEAYFSRAFSPVPGNIKSRISKALDAVNFNIPLDRRVGGLSGGQQARLLLAYALVQDPDILLLDEPTNNLDKDGIDHLITFLVMYDKTVLVISHDADFLNCFTEGVIYLNNFTHQTEMYVGDYYSVVEEIGRRVEREQRENAQLEKQIQDRKEKVNFFAHKGGKMRKLAKKLKDETEDLEENMVDVRREDKTIRDFEIPVQEELSGEIVILKKIRVIKNHEPIFKNIDKVLRKKDRLLVVGPNGIGKSTLLRSLVSGKQEGQSIAKNVRVGYYSQDFSTLNFEETVFNSLKGALADGLGEQELRSTAAGFLITGDLMGHKVGDLSEGQKGLLAFARLVLMRPGILILDEPTNHINFRHIPIIAAAINAYHGPIIMVSHMPEFVKEIRITEELDLGKL
ncbi:MAG: ATP-binding cassette domain-containing protein [Candidatus Falkowbacteria bacterium]|nr:ATP-binding cassette domain-containing protein [Candidatus Falkowbacteria bacterium]